MTKLDEAIKNINKTYGFDIVGKSSIKKKNYGKIPLTTPAVSSRYSFQWQVYIFLYGMRTGTERT